MRIGLFAPFASPFATRDYLLRFATLADERGFHSLWLGEHVVLFDEYRSRYPYSADGRIPAGPRNGMLEPLTTLAFLAARTQRIRLATGICLVPQRNPVYTAKETANLDWLSGGRLDFGVGLGWLREEFEALGVPWPRRGARCREYLEVIRRLWTEDEPRFDGEFYTLPPCRQDPKPIQSPHPPIHFGGESDAALRRVADLGQGWHPVGLDPDGLAERVGVLAGLMRERGRSLDELEITAAPYFGPVDPDVLGRYHDAGATQLAVMPLALTPEDIEPTLDGLEATLVRAARAL